MAALVITQKIQGCEQLPLIGVKQSVDTLHRRFHRQLGAQHPLQHLRNKLGTAGCLGTAAHPVADRADRRLTIAEHRAGITGNLRIFF